MRFTLGVAYFMQVTFFALVFQHEQKFLLVRLTHTQFLAG